MISIALRRGRSKKNSFSAPLPASPPRQSRCARRVGLSGHTNPYFRLSTLRWAVWSKERPEVDGLIDCQNRPTERVKEIKQTDRPSWGRRSRPSGCRVYVVDKCSWMRSLWCCWDIFWMIKWFAITWFAQTPYAAVFRKFGILVSSHHMSRLYIMVPKRNKTGLFSTST